MSRHPPNDLTDREISGQTATKVMGWRTKSVYWPATRITTSYYVTDDERFRPPETIVMEVCDWDPVNNGSHNWMVLDRLVVLGLEWDVEKDELAELPGLYVARVTTLELNPGADGTWTAYDDNPKHAVCLAALMAVGHE